MPKTFRLIALSLVGLAILLGLIALGMGKRDSTAASGTVRQDTPPSPQIIVAAKTLPAGKPLELGDLGSVEVPEGSTVGYMTSPLQAKGLIPARDIPEGTHLRSDHFLRGLSSHLHPGERAIALGVDEIGAVGNHIEPGDYVDVYLNLDDRSAPGSLPAAHSGAISRLLASRVRVLAIGGGSVAEDGSGVAGDMPAGQPADSTLPEGNERAEAINARVNNQQATAPRPRSRGGSAAVLAVPPDDAAVLLLAAQEGRLSLSLRHPADPSIANRHLFQPSGPVMAGIGEGLNAEDRAFAGVSAQQLVAKAPAPPVRASPARTQPGRHGTSTRGQRSSGVQIIRGSEAPRALSTK